MPTKLLNMILVLTVAFIMSCEERYWPELDANTASALVVDGVITNALPPYTINLSRSSNVESHDYIPMSNYEVSIVDNFGNEELLNEMEAGRYVSSADGMQGIVGRNYKLILRSPDGRYYNSEFEMLKEPIGIESVYTEVEYEDSETPPYQIPGYRFYINTELAQNDSTYLFWLLDETYKFESDYYIYFYYDGTLHPVVNRDTLKNCWGSGRVFPFFVESTLSLSEPRFTHYPLHFVNTKTRKLSVKYSLLVNQYTINKNVFRFWNSVKQQNEDGGELYPRQPFQVRGNVYNVDDENELVLGFFMVAGVAQKRIFVDRPTLPVKMYYPICELTEDDFEAYGFMFIGGGTASWPLFITEDENGSRALPNQACIDCTYKGGSLDEPDFWTDN